MFSMSQDAYIVLAKKELIPAEGERLLTSDLLRARERRPKDSPLSSLYQAVSACPRNLSQE